jgi:hypothetical protein
VPKVRSNPFGELKVADRPKRRAVLAMALGLALSPLVFEGSSLCAAQWRSMAGPVVSVQTPVLDTFGWIFTSIGSSVSQSISSMFHSVPWRPSVVIPLTFVWAGCASLLLRRR